MVDRKGLGLEIGPSHNPLTPKKQGFNVHILDHASADELRVKYKGHEGYGVKLENIEEVGYVWYGEPLHELVGREQCYDWIIASHVIEHCPDMISFLVQCEKLLKPSGILSLVIPDKRYCFDFFRWPSSTGEALQAHIERRTKHVPGVVFDHFSSAAQFGESIAWSKGLSGELRFVHTLDEAISIWRQSIDTNEYIDTHHWRFTPSSFRLILSDLGSIGFTDLAELGGFDTAGCEFFISLGKQKSDKPKYDRLLLAKSMVREIAEGATQVPPST